MFTLMIMLVSGLNICLNKIYYDQLNDEENWKGGNKISTKVNTQKVQSTFFFLFFFFLGHFTKHSSFVQVSLLMDGQIMIMILSKS